MTMSTAAAGAYLEVLRKHQNLSRDKVAKHLKTSRSQIERIEGGIGETRLTQLVAFVRFVQGKVDDVVSLLDTGHTAEDGRTAALAYIEKRAKEIAEGVPQERVPDAIRLLEELETNPEARAKLVKFIRDAVSGGA